MAEKKPAPKKSWLDEHFGLAIIMFIVGVFILWVLTGGPSKSGTKSDWLNSPEAPKSTFGPTNTYDN